jgi:hypothetical protein
VSECDREASIMRRPWPIEAVKPWKKQTDFLYTAHRFYTTRRFWGKSNVFSLSFMQIGEYSLDELTPCSSIELEKLRLSQPIKKFHASKITVYNRNLVVPRNLYSQPAASQHNQLKITSTPGALPVLFY